jgi:hypothetical protein
MTDLLSLPQNDLCIRKLMQIGCQKNGMFIISPSRDEHHSPPQHNERIAMAALEPAGEF